MIYFSTLYKKYNLYKTFFSEGIKYKLNYTISKISLQRCLHIHVEMSSFYSTCICNLLVSQWLFSYVLDLQIYIKQKKVTNIFRFLVCTYTNTMLNLFSKQQYKKGFVRAMLN